MSIVATALQDQLYNLREDGVKSDQASKSLRECILSKTFLGQGTDYDKDVGFMNTFLKYISELLVTLVTLEEAAASASPITPRQSNIPSFSNETENSGLPPGHHQTLLPEIAAANAQTAFSYARAIVVSVLLVISGFLTLGEVLEPSWFVLIIAGALLLLFFDSIKSMIMSFLKKEEKPTTGIASLDWIVENFSWIRQKYRSAFFLIHVQTATIENLPEDFMLPDTPDALINRRKFFEATLPTDFLERIDRVIVRCKKDVWLRQQVLINAIAASSQSAGVPGR